MPTLTWRFRHLVRLYVGVWPPKREDCASTSSASVSRGLYLGSFLCKIVIRGVSRCSIPVCVQVQLGLAINLCRDVPDEILPEMLRQIGGPF